MLIETGTPAEENRGKKSEPAPGRVTDPAWAWAPYVPDQERPWDLRWAGHLYRRAGFGANWDELQRALGDGPQPTVDRLLRPEGDVAAFNRTYDDYETSSIPPDSGSTESLRQWWLRRMILTPHPLLEKMTLFWHGYFATSNVRVNNARLMQQHIQLLRTHALGRFSALLAGIANDAATLLSLEAAANRKARPTENFARALVESFTLSPGVASAEDVRQTARALSGWFVLRGQLRFIPREHDPGTKKILGQEGSWQAEDAVRIVLGHPATPRRLVRSLYRWLISETEEPAETLVAPLAESLAKDYDVAKLTETMLRSKLFFSPAAYRQRVKCPVEYALGLVRGLEELVPTSPLGEDLAALGQNLGHPPTVAGWAGARAWINRFTLLGRNNLAAALLAGTDDRYGGKLSAAAVAAKHGSDESECGARFLLDLFLQGDVEPAVRELLLKSVAEAGSTGSGDLARRLRDFAHLVVTLPEFHLA